MDTSVIILSNREKYIDKCILSLAKQTVKPKEVIILYPKQTEDDTFRLNRGIAMVTAETFVILGDDDKLHPQFIEKTLAKMEETGCDIVYTDMEQFGEHPGIHKPFGWRPEVMYENFGIFVTSLVRKRLWEKVGGFDPFCGPFADWDFWWRCGEVDAKTEYLPEPLFLYRTHPEQDSQKLSKDMCEWSKDYIREKHAKLKNQPKRHK